MNLRYTHSKERIEQACIPEPGSLKIEKYLLRIAGKLNTIFPDFYSRKVTTREYLIYMLLRMQG